MITSCMVENISTLPSTDTGGPLPKIVQIQNIVVSPWFAHQSSWSPLEKRIVKNTEWIACALAVMFQSTTQTIKNEWWTNAFSLTYSNDGLFTPLKTFA